MIWFVLAFAFDQLGQIGAVIELALEKLHSNDGEDEVEEHVDDKDVEDVFEWVHHAVEYRFQFRHSIYSLERSQHSKYSERFDRV